MAPTNRHFITAFIIFLALSVVSCGNGGSGGGSSTPPYVYAEIVSFPDGASSASVYVIDDSSGNSITSAVVTMNDVTLNYNANYQVYEGNLMVAPGEDVILSVTVGGNTYTTSGTQFTSYPTITAPPSGNTWHTAYASYVTWSGVTIWGT